MSQLYPLPIHTVVFIALIKRRKADSKIYSGAGDEKVDTSEWAGE